MRSHLSQPISTTEKGSAWHFHAAVLSAKAFTLVELLVVIVIMGILMGMLLPALNKARISSLITQSLSNLHNTGLAIDQYAMDHDGAYPLIFDASTAASWIASVWPYPYPTKNFPGTTPQALKGSIFYTALSEDPTNARTFGLSEPLELTFTSRRYKQLVKKQSSVGLAGDVKNSGSFRVNQINYRNNGRANVLYLDGHVGSVLPAEVPALTSTPFWTGTQ